MYDTVYVVYGRPVNTDGKLGATYIGGVFRDPDEAWAAADRLGDGFAVAARTIFEEAEYR
jgi:hypothetical protein